MNSGYKIGGRELSDVVEFFTTDEQNTHTVIDSRLTNGQNLYKKGGADLKLALNGTFPTSAGADYPGGYNLLPPYKTNGAPIDVALKGCRPIGIPLKDVGAGSYVIYRSGDKTYFVSGNQPTGGEELAHSPQYVFFELQGPGGGGGGTQNLYSGSGGASGAYMFGCLKISSPVYITVGQGGRGGTGVTLGKGEDGHTGTASTIQTQYGGVTYTLTAGSGTGGEGGNNGNKGGTAGTCSFTPQLIDDTERYKIIGQYPGSPGSSRRTPASEQNGKEAVYNHWLKPEGGSFTRPGGSGGSSKDEAGHGGGGGASVFGDGANGRFQNDGITPTAYGAGGSGGGNYVGRKYDGGAGADGRFILYY
jgi:hypothetical protein